MFKQTKTINLSLPNETYREVDRLSRQKRLSKSEILRWALKQYIAWEEIWSEIYQWGKESSKDLKIKNEEDVNQLIHQFRKEHKK